MKNVITITIPFSFRGVDHKPSALIDLDVLVKNNHTMDFIFHYVAKENNIGRHSYEFEVLESSPQLFSDPTGVACEFFDDHCFDLDSFKDKLNELNIIDELNIISKDILGINNLEDQSDLKAALLKAYNMGKEAGKEHTSS